MFTTANNEEDLVKIFEAYQIDKASTLASAKYSEGILSLNV